MVQVTHVVSITIRVCVVVVVLDEIRVRIHV